MPDAKLTVVDVPVTVWLPSEQALVEPHSTVYPEALDTAPHERLTPPTTGVAVSVGVARMVHGVV